MRGRKMKRQKMQADPSPFNRWRLCITDTDAVFGFALGSLFIEKSFNGRSKPVAQVCSKKKKFD